jgi:hypothetical protein
VAEKKYLIDARWWRKWCDYTGLKLGEDFDNPEYFD